MLRTYLRANKQNHTYIRYTGGGAASAPVSGFGILTEGGDNIVTEDSNAIVQEG